MNISVFHGGSGGGAKRSVIRLLAVNLALMGVSALFYWMFQSYILKKAEENIANLLLSHKGIHHYVQKTMIPAYSDYQKEGKIKEAFYAPELLSSLFIVRNQHAYYNRERMDAGFSPLYYKLAAKNPRNPVNRADALEEELIAMFNEKRDVRSYREIVKIDEKNFLYVAIPFLVNQPHCIRCHGRREDAPAELQKRYPGQGGFNESVGEIRAITSIRAPIEDEFIHIYSIGLAICMICFAFVGLFLFNTRLRSLVQRKTESLEKEIDERIHTEETLSRNRSMLEQILNATPHSIFWKDRKGVYLGCNRVFAKSVGLDSPERIICRTDAELHWPEAERRKYRADDEEVMRFVRPQIHIIEPMQKADGSRLMVDTSKVPLLDKHGEVYGVLGIYEDITEKLKFEDQLRQMQRLEAMGTLAGGIAHDFNNILSPILGYAEMVQDAFSEESREWKNQQAVIDAGLRARDLVKQILAFARQAENERQPIQIHLIAKEALKLLRASIPSTIEIRQNISTDSGVVHADPTQIHQVIMNLCTNAYHAMEKTGGTLGLSSAAVEIEKEDEKVHGLDLAPGKYLRLEVSDTGCGMDKKTLDRIFEPYFTTKEKGKGTGLGLAMVHGIVKSHNGHITVYSEPGKGTCFRIYLPRFITDAEKKTTERKISPPTGTERVMVVDDEPAIAGMIGEMLENLGYEVTALSVSPEAWDRLRRRPQAFDLVITDMTMPDMTGAELARRYLSLRPDAKIILCTGFSELINEEKARAIGICEYIMKPIIRRELAHAVRRVLDSVTP